MGKIKMADVPDIDLYADDLGDDFHGDNDEPTGDGVDLYDDVLTSSSTVKSESVNGKEKITTLSSSFIYQNSQSSSSSFIGAPLQLHGNSHSSKRVQLYVGNLTWVRFIPFNIQ